MYLAGELVLQMSVGLTDRGTVHIIAEKQRPRLKEDKRRKKEPFTSKTGP